MGSGSVTKGTRKQEREEDLVEDWVGLRERQGLLEEVAQKGSSEGSSAVTLETSETSPMIS